MRITNPTNQDIKNIKIGENIYNINAGETLENVPEYDARYWQENLHKFLILKKDKEVIVDEKIEIPTPTVKKVEEVKEEEIIPEEEVIPEIEPEVTEEKVEEEKPSILSKLKGKKGK